MKKYIYLFIPLLLFCQNAFCGKDYSASKTMYVGATLTLSPKSDCGASYCFGTGITYDTEAFHVEKVKQTNSLGMQNVNGSTTGTFYTFKLTALKAGVYTVRCTVSYYESMSGYKNKSNVATYTITVKEVPKVVSISIPPSLSLLLGDVYSFSPIIYETGASTTLTWYSSNASVATIDGNGLLTTKGVGKTTITCTATNGVSASCTVTVNPIVATSVSLGKTALSLNIGGSETLKATVKPSNVTNSKVKWTTSNSSVATVDQNGLVTAMSLGTATIKATTTDGTNLSASCNVTVNPIMASSIRLTQTEWETKVGKSFTLKATVSPSNVTNGKVKWSTSNTLVATVDQDGVVTGIAVGNATISATTTDGTNLTASCSVTVSPVLATSIRLTQTEWETRVGKSFTLKATVGPSNVTNGSVKWNSSDTNVATVDQAGLVTGIKSGAATITATTLDGTNLSASCAVKVIGDEATNTLKPSDVKIAKGSITILPIELDNQKNIVALQFELELPDGIEVILDNDGNVMANLTERKNNHTLSSSILPNGNSQFVALAIPTSRFGGYEGAVINVRIKADKDKALGENTVWVRNIELTMESDNVLTVLKPADAKATLTVTNVVMGDVNSDGNVTVTDAASVVNHILQKTPQGFIFEAADVNGDGNITVTDAASIVNIILNGN